MTSDIERLVDATIALASYGIHPDTQDLLLKGDPVRGIKPGALLAALRTEIDGQRWRALLSSQRIRLQGWAGFDENGVPAPSMDPRNYMHFGVDFWSHHSSSEGSHFAKTLLTNYADAIIKGKK